MESTEKNYYLATVKIKNVIDTKHGPKTKYARELYLVEGVSVTDVDAKVNKEFKDVTFEFEISNVRAVKIQKVLK